MAAQFLQLYGLQKIATLQLKQFTRGLRDPSHRHVRLRLFRTVSAHLPLAPAGRSCSCDRSPKPHMWPYTSTFLILAHLKT